MKHIHLLIVFLVFPLFGYAKLHVCIERYRPERDAAAVEQIYRDFAHFLIEEPIARVLQATAQSARMYVLREGNETVGFVNCDVYQKLLRKTNVRLSKNGVLNGLGVDKKHQHKGYGKMLLEYALQEFKKNQVSYVYLMVNQDNPVAWHIYEKSHFIRTVSWISPVGTPKYWYRYFLGNNLPLLAAEDFIEFYPPLRCFRGFFYAVNTY